MAVVLVGCSAPESDVASHYDDFNGFRTDVMARNLLPLEEPATEAVWLNASRLFVDFRNYRFYLEARYETRAETGLLNVGSGPNLILEIDGEKRVFRGLGSFNARDASDDIVSEDALFEVTADDLRQIANGTLIDLTLKGEGRVYQQRFSGDNIRRFREFVAAYVDTEDTDGFRGPRFR